MTDQVGGLPFGGHLSTPFSPATGSFNGLHTKNKFLVIYYATSVPPINPNHIEEMHYRCLLVVIAAMLSTVPIAGCSKADQVESDKESAALPDEGKKALVDWLAQRVQKLDDTHRITLSEFSSVSYSSHDTWDLPGVRRSEPGNIFYAEMFAKQVDLAGFRWRAEELPLREAEKRNAVSESYNIRFLASAARAVNEGEGFPWSNVDSDVLHAVWLVCQSGDWKVYHSGDGDWSRIETISGE